MAFSSLKPDIKVTVRFLTTAEGGRKTAVKSGYRPQFFYNGHHWDAMHKYPKEEILLGEDTLAELYFLSSDEHFGKIHVGMSFEIFEGSKKVGEGRILEILALEENAQMELEFKRTGVRSWLKK